MLKNWFVSRRQGFTLIELLIVVAIIAILAAIAVPNFLEAQTRSKVSRCLADMRTMRTALEAYRVDNNWYPETDTSITAASTPPYKRAQLRLTTPVSFISSLPVSPFKEKYGGTNRIASAFNGYLYTRKKDQLLQFDASYEKDRLAYVLMNPSTPVPVDQKRIGEWCMKSVGPDNYDDRDTPANNGFDVNARVYDPTNGTISRGDIVQWSDLPGTGK